MANQPPPLWNLVEKWKAEEGSQEYSAYTHAKRMCANELAALLRDHAVMYSPVDPWLNEFILGVPEDK